MLGCLILAILIGFIAVDIIRSRPKSQPKVAKEETLKCDKLEPAVPAPEEPAKETIKCDKPKPAIPAPEEAPKETFVCSNCKRELNKKYLYKWGMCADCVANSPNYTKPAPAVFAPKETLKYTKAEREAYLQQLCQTGKIETSTYSKAEREAFLRRLNERSRIENYLKDDELGSYMMYVERDQYLIRYMSDTAMQHPPVVLRRPFSTSESIRLLDELCSCSKWQQSGIRTKYIGSLKDFLQSDNKARYYIALEYIYYHLLLETSPDADVKLKQLRILDDAELYKLFKDSIPRNIDYLRMVSYGVARTYDCTLYEIVQKIDKMFRSAPEQDELSVPE